MLLKAPWKWWLLVAWMYAFLAVICVWRVDYDYGWHYRSGEYILHYGLPRFDVFTYTAMHFKWINHEWLNDVLMYLTERTLGHNGVGLIFAVIWTAALTLGAKGRLSWAVAGAALGAVMLFVGMRPLAWTALGLAVCLRIMAARPKRWWWLVPLFLVWANLHAGFAIGLAMILLKAAVERSRRLGWWGLAALAVTFVNPYGPGVYLELWRTMSDTRLAGRVVEWSPVNFNLATLPYLLLAGVIVALWKQWDFERWRGMGLLLAAVAVGRHMPLLVVGTLAAVNAQIEHAYSTWKTRWLGVTSVLMGIGFPMAVLLWPPAVSGSSKLVQPNAELMALQVKPCDGELFNNYNYGGVVMKSLPGVKVYIDGRMPSWGSPRGSYLDLYFRVQSDGGFADEEFDRYGVQCALLANTDERLRTHLRQSPEWRLAVKADEAELWRRD